MIRRLLAGLLVGLLLVPFAAQALTLTLTLEGSATQGGLMVGRAAPGATITLNGQPVAVTRAGDFVLGFGRDAKPTATLVLRHPDGRTEKRVIGIKARSYKIQRIDGLPKRKVEPKKRDMTRIVAERDLFRAVRARLTPQSWFRSGFVWPVTGRISGVYGSQRILNGKPRSPHLGTDIAAPTGTNVVAAADGVVALAHDGMFFTGKTIHIDHGLGLGTVYAHLSALGVKQGARVKKGQLIGRIGQTGRATGPHLHWGLTLGALRLDPALAAGPMPGR